MFPLERWFVDIAANMKLPELQGLIQEHTGIAPHLQILKTGFPPMPMHLPADVSHLAIGDVFPNEQVVHIDQKPTDAHPSVENTAVLDERRHLAEQGTRFQSGVFPTLPSSVESSDELTTASFEGGNGHLMTSNSNHDEELDRAIAISLSEIDPAVPPSYPSEEFEPGPVFSDRLEDGSYIVRRFVDSDNSCLFTAVAYVMEGNRLKGFDLRGVIAATVRSDPGHYNAAFLGRPNAEYCEWIINPQHWGGEIELMILSQHYRIQIATYDIQTTNCYVYGSDSGFSERVMLVYDGIHYDALARTPQLDAPEELDMRIYDPLTAEGQMITEAAVNLVQKFNETNQFTNTARFQLRCDECGRGFSGTSTAVEHQRVTGHFNFSEYR